MSQPLVTVEYLELEVKFIQVPRNTAPGQDDTTYYSKKLPKVPIKHTIL